MCRLIAAICLTLFLTATHLWADACTGFDQRAGLSAGERASLAARLAATPFPEGLHWRATKGAQVLHVVGTMHVDDPRHDAIFASLAPLIEQAELVLVETTPAEEARLQKAMSEDPGLIFITEGPSLIDRMPPDTWAQLEAAAAARGIPGFMAAKFRPWYLSLILSMPPCVLQQVQAGERGLDHRIIRHTERSGVPMRALDAYDVLFRIMDADPIEAQIEYLKLGLLPEDVALNSITTLANSYFEERAAEVFEVARIVSHRHIDLPEGELDALFDQMMSRVLDDRNMLWMPQIMAAPDGLTLVAVGAGHLPGTNGVLNLLEQAGYTLERLPI